MADDPLLNPPLSPTGSDASSHTSASSRKRDRADEEDDPEFKLPVNKRAPPKKKKASLESLADQLNSVATKLGQHDTRFDDIHSAIGTVGIEVTTLKATVNRLSAITETLVTETKTLAKENETLKKSHKDLESRLDALSVATGSDTNKTDDNNLKKLIAATNATTIGLQKANSSKATTSEIVVSGFSLGNIGKAALMQIALAIFTTIKIDIKPDEITDANFFRKADTPTDTNVNPVTERQSATKARRTSFAVVLAEHSLLARILAAKRSFGMLRYAQINPALLSHPDLSTEQPGNPTINVNELVPTSTFKLLVAAKTALKAAGFKYIWCRDGTVYAKAHDSALIQIVNNMADIPNIAELYADPPL